MAIRRSSSNMENCNVDQRGVYTISYSFSPKPFFVGGQLGKYTYFTKILQSQTISYLKDLSETISTWLFAHLGRIFLRKTYNGKKVIGRIPLKRWLLLITASSCIWNDSTTWIGWSFLWGFPPNVAPPTCPNPLQSNVCDTKLVIGFFEGSGGFTQTYSPRKWKFVWNSVGLGIYNII